MSISSTPDTRRRGIKCSMIRVSHTALREMGEGGEGRVVSKRETDWVWDIVVAAVAARVSSIVILKNCIPSTYVHHDLYYNLIPNTDEEEPFYQQLPRLGAFEVSYQGNLIYSKILSNKWPNINLVADRCANIIDAQKKGEEIAPFLSNYVRKEGDKEGDSAAHNSTGYNSSMQTTAKKRFIKPNEYNSQTAPSY